MRYVNRFQKKWVTAPKAAWHKMLALTFCNKYGNSPPSRTPKYRDAIAMSIWLSLIPALSNLFDKIIPDPDAREKAKLELLKVERESDLDALKLALSADQMQTDINKTESTHRNLFVAGWRPFIGWVCGVAFAYHFIIQPILAFIIANHGAQVQLPAFDIDALFTVLMGMLGLGGLRTIEKIKKRDI